MDQDSKMLLQYQIPHKDIVRGKMIGEGSFGTVYKGVLRGEIDVAVKTMRVTKITEKELEKFRKELMVSSSACMVNVCVLTSCATLSLSRRS